MPQSALSVAHARFACALYERVRQTSGNLCLSPYSVAMALSMTLVGARGRTQAGMIGALALDELADADVRDEAARALLELLRGCERSGGQVEKKKRKKGKKGATGAQGAVALAIANALWADAGETLAPEFVARLHDFYGARAAQLDFGDGEGARQEINRWVAEQTRGEIEELLAPGSVDGARLVLTNAVYFLGSWAERFDPASTHPLPFQLGSGETVSVPMMYRCDELATARGSGWQAVELPYVGEQLSMLLYLPASAGPGALAELEATLEPGWLAPSLRETGQEVLIRVPRFSLDCKRLLNEDLIALGMDEAFSSSADFSGISRGLFISDVHHAASVRVDEAGTVAAAATAVVMTRGASREPLRMIFDRPFLFVIRERSTGTPLFIGRVADPRG